MSIAKNNIIKKDEIFEYLISKDYEEIDTVAVEGNFFGAAFQNKEGYFWIRNNNDLFQTSNYNVGTSYNQYNRVEYSGEVYESLVDANLGNQPDISPSFWYLIPNGVSESSYLNVNFRAHISGSVNSDGDQYEYTLWSVAWDGNGDEILTQVYYNNDDLKDSSVQMSRDPGYYKYKLRVGSQGLASRTTAWIYVKRYANDMKKFDKIRVFTSDFKELEPLGSTNVTVALTKAGRLTTENFFGGDYEGN